MTDSMLVSIRTVGASRFRWVYRTNIPHAAGGSRWPLKLPVRMRQSCTMSTHAVSSERLWTAALSTQVRQICLKDQCGACIQVLAWLAFGRRSSVPVDHVLELVNHSKDDRRRSTSRLDRERARKVSKKTKGDNRPSHVLLGLLQITPSVAIGGLDYKVKSPPAHLKCIRKRGGMFSLRQNNCSEGWPCIKEGQTSPDGGECSHARLGNVCASVPRAQCGGLLLARDLT